MDAFIMFFCPNKVTDTVGMIKPFNVVKAE